MPEHGLLPYFRTPYDNGGKEVRALRSLLSFRIWRLFPEPYILYCVSSPSIPGGSLFNRRSGRCQWKFDQRRAGYARWICCHTSYTINTPHPSFAAANTLVPNQTMPTIGDRLSTANVSWAWYSGGWNDALAGHPDSLFQFHHQPFAYFANYADGTTAKATHLKDEADFIAAAKAGTLPAVSLIKPLGEENEHPGYADIATGERHLEELINDVRNGPNWNDCMIIVTYDEHGGFWDHVPPPTIDKWGPGIRVPGILISPFAKTDFVDNTQYETVSILSLIEHRWNLQPLGTRDANANYFLNAFNF